MLEKYSEIISKVVLFVGIKNSEISTMLECFKPKVLTLSKNELIVSEGEAFKSIGVLLEGEASVVKETAAGNRIVMDILSPGDIFGEMVAFSSRKLWPATVTAQDTCKVLFLPMEKLIGECEGMCSWHRVFIQNFLRVVSEKALMLNKKVEYLTIKSMRGKISTYLLEQYKRTGNKNIVLPLKRNELADFLNVSRPSMSREMCKMRDEGVIDFHLAAFKILDLEALKTMSTL